MNDEQVSKLLKRACWSSAGWKDHVDLTAEEIASLQEAGYAPDDRDWPHDDWVAWAIGACSGLSRERVSDAFVWSLTAQRLDYRSALGSYAYLHRMPEHRFERAPKYLFEHCSVCGAEPAATITQQDFIRMNFERHHWGGVDHGSLTFAAFDLEMFASLPDVSPSKEGWQALRSILDAADDPVTGKSVSSLKKAIRGIIKANDWQADTLCHILSYTGILASEEYPGLDRQYVRFVDQSDLRPESDQKYPLNCWKGPGIRTDAVEVWFPGIASA